MQITLNLNPKARAEIGYYSRQFIRDLIHYNLDGILDYKYMPYV